MFQVTDKNRLYAPKEASSIIDEIWNRNRYRVEPGFAPGDAVVDIGANIGVFSVYAAGKGATVYSFEPNPDAFAILQRNARENGYSESIKPYNMAVGDGEAELELAIPDSEKLYSFGSATTTHSNREQLRSINEVRLRTIKVPCTTLPEILSGFVQASATVRLLKIDCEGAEWGILRSMIGRGRPGVRKLAMETHLGYSEKAMVDLLGELGFVITGFVKRSGFFHTGYIFASAAGTDPGARAATGVVSVLDAPKFALEDEEVTFRSGDSFSLSPEKGTLTRSWRIDDRFLGSGIDLKTKLEPGVHVLVLSVADGRREDHSTFRITILAKGYFAADSGLTFLPAESKARFELSGKRRFAIASASLPGTWEIGGVKIGINRVIDGMGDHGGLSLDFNGKTLDISDFYSEHHLDLSTNQLDIRFDLRCGRKEIVEISWWPIDPASAAEMAGGIPELRESERGIRLRPAGSAGLVQLTGHRTFFLGKEMLPEDWTPKVLKIGIATVPVDGQNEPLSGYLEHRGTRQELSGWYSEVQIRDFHSDQDVELSISLLRSARLKLIWWGE